MLPYSIKIYIDIKLARMMLLDFLFVLPDEEQK